MADRAKMLAELKQLIERVSDPSTPRAQLPVADWELLESLEEWWDDRQQSERMVLVGRYPGSDTFAVWDTPFDDVVATNLARMRKEQTKNETAILEVAVRRKAVLATAITLNDELIDNHDAD